MNRKAVLGLTAALASALVLVGAPAASAERSSAGVGSAAARPSIDAIGLTSDQRLARFSLDPPRQIRSVVTVSGLVGDTSLIGIDYRVQNGLLYGVGNVGGIYTLNDATGAATKVSQLSVALAGTDFGVDFNPAADRLRVISDSGQNLRHDLTAGVTTVDVGLTYPPALPAATGVSGAAYTNNDLNPNTGTTLFDLDTSLDQIAIQAPANSGQLSATGKLTVDVGANAGFDIYSQLSNGSTVAVFGWATVSVNGSYRLFEINLLTGSGRDRGGFPRNTAVFDIAIPLNQ